MQFDVFGRKNIIKFSSKKYNFLVLISSEERLMCLLKISVRFCFLREQKTISTLFCLFAHFDIRFSANGTENAIMQ